jgi:hypothetical protein
MLCTANRGTVQKVFIEKVIDPATSFLGTTVAIEHQTFINDKRKFNGQNER